jgi:hypothetical protein
LLISQRPLPSLRNQPFSRRQICFCKQRLRTRRRTPALLDTVVYRRDDVVEDLARIRVILVEICRDCAFDAFYNVWLVGEFIGVIRVVALEPILSLLPVELEEVEELFRPILEIGASESVFPAFSLWERQLVTGDWWRGRVIGWCGLLCSSFS